MIAPVRNHCPVAHQEATAIAGQGFELMEGKHCSDHMTENMLISLKWSVRARTPAVEGMPIREISTLYC